MILIIFLFKLIILNSDLVLSQTNETIVKNCIFNDYDKTVRPADYVELSLKLTLKQIVSLDEKSQIVTTSSFLFLYWIDQRLQWNPSNFSGIHAMSIAVNSVWLPDLYIINTADTNGYLPISDSAYGYLFNNGVIIINVGLIGLKTRCPVNIYRFPFDQQRCSIIIGSWFQDKSWLGLKLDEKYNTSNLIEYVNNPIWSLKKVSVDKIKSGSRFLYIAENDDLYFNFTIKRQPMYYMINNVYPCLILNAVTLITFFFPFNIQTSLTITTFLNMGIIAVRVTNDVPVQSEYMPLIGLYFFLNMFYTFISFLWFSINENLKSKIFKSNVFFSKLNLFKLKFFMKVKPHENGREFEQKEFQLELSLINKCIFIVMLFTMILSYSIIWLIISN